MIFLLMNWVFGGLKDNDYRAWFLSELSFICHKFNWRGGGFFIMSCHYLDSRLLPAMRNCVRGGRGGVPSSMCLTWYLLLLRSQGDKCLTVRSLVRRETSEQQNLSAVSWHLMKWTVQCGEEWYITRHWSQIFYEGVRFCVWLWIQTKKKQ